MRKLAMLMAVTALSTATPAFADEASLQAEIAALKAQLATQSQLIAAQSKRLDDLAAQVKDNPQLTASPSPASLSLSSPSAVPVAVAANEAAVDTSPSLPIGRPAQVSAISIGSDTMIGGYGEIAYNAYVHDGSRNQADLKRLVLFVGHRFNDKLSFNSELEVEHAIASASDKGEFEVEQAWLNYAFKPSLNLKAGLFLMPFGFLNRNHEPPVFYGVERNEVETRIIPTTWREGGIGLWGDTPIGLSYDVGVTTGFNVAKFDDAGSPLAAAHQELQFAKAANLSVYGSLEYKGVPGVLVGGAIFHGGVVHRNADFREDNTLPDFAGINSQVTLWDVHGRWQPKGFDFEALYARGTYSRADKIDNVLIAYNMANNSGRPFVPSAFYGWLVQGAYSFPLGGEATLNPFVRYEKFETQAKLPLGLVADPLNHDRILTTGFSFHPIQIVVVKIDYQKFFENHGNNRFDFGIGYSF